MARAAVTRPAQKTCFLCCKPIHGKATTEHFLPRCFYEGRRVPNEPGLTLPAHGECNASTTDEEEWVAHSLALSDPLPGPKGERWDRAIRALKLPRAMSQAFVGSILQLPDGGAALPMGVERATWVYAKIVKGLSYRTCGALLGPGTPWSVRVGDYAHAIQLGPPHTPILVEIPAKGPDRGTMLIAKGVQLGETAFVWVMILQGKHPIFVTTLPPELLPKEAARDEHDFMNLTWPKPRPARVATRPCSPAHRVPPRSSRCRRLRQSVLLGRRRPALVGPPRAWRPRVPVRGSLPR